MYDLSRPLNIPDDGWTEGYCGRDAGKRDWFGKGSGWIGWDCDGVGNSGFSFRFHFSFGFYNVRCSDG